jgi:hypothetical protein
MRLRTCILTLLAVATLAFAGLASAAAAPPKLTEDNAKLVLSNDQVQVWFQGKKPTLRVLPAAAMDENATGAFTYKFVDVVEYRDLDGNGAPSQGEVVASLNLDRADGWKVEKTQTDGAVVLNLSLNDSVKLAKADLPKPPVDLPVDQVAQVGLVFTLRGDDATIAAAPVVNLTVKATSIKYDFLVAKWPFVDAANDRLALETMVTGVAKDANLTGVDQAAVATTNGTALGALSWTTTAQGTTAAGAPVPVPVRAALASADAGQTSLAFTYDAPGLVTLAHDPTVGLAPAAVQSTGGVAGSGILKPSPAPELALAVGVAGLAALVLRKR